MRSRIFGLLLVLTATGMLATPSVAQMLGEVGVEQLTADLSSAEKTDFGTKALTEMREAVREVAKLLEAAEREKDVVRLQCLSKKLTTMRALLEVSEGSMTTMQEAISAAEDQRADHEYRKIAIALAKVRQFREEARQCVGGSGTNTNNSVVEILTEPLEGEEDGAGFDIDVFDPPGLEVSPWF